MTRALGDLRESGTGLLIEGRKINLLMGIFGNQDSTHPVPSVFS
jgi:hypothetical protein